MSSMLEQAIVDANALREVAIKTAESNLVEKYSNQIKEAVETLLEQPLPGEEDPMAALGGDPAAAMDPAAMMAPAPMPGPEPGPGAEGVEAPLAATEGEKLCPCPEEEEVVVVKLDDLVRQAEEADLEGEEGDFSPKDVEALGEPVEDEELEDEEEEEIPLEESIEVTEDELVDLLETLKVDVSPDSVRSGWAGMPSAYLDEAEELELARRRDDKVSEDLEELLAAVEELQESNEHYENMLLEAKNYIGKLEKQNQEKLNQAAQTLEEVKEVAYTLKDKLDEANKSNARLLYTNKVLSNNLSKL